MSLQSTSHTVAPEPLADEADAAPVAGFTARSLKKARLRGLNHPPYIRIGSRVKYVLSEVIAWRQAHAVRPPISNSRPATLQHPFMNKANNPFCNPLAGSSKLSDAAALVALHESAEVQRATRNVVAARDGLSYERRVMHVLSTAVRAVQNSSSAPTPAAVFEELQKQAHDVDAELAAANAAAEEIVEARRTYRAMILEPIRAATCEALADLRARRDDAVRERETGVSMTEAAGAAELELVAAGVNVDALKAAGVAFPAAPDSDTSAVKTRANLAIHALTPRLAALEKLLKLAVIDLDALDAIAADHDAIANAVAQVRAALAQPLAKVA
ncbi:MAG: hypothetical protein EOO22_07465 [Comamonadaceae bacterium]|nr:MAG: hypothetical protein EOO22_07465 [Comamonadaceae bacterium]